jgi:hypothetical protein
MLQFDIILFSCFCYFSLWKILCSTLSFFDIYIVIPFLSKYKKKLSRGKLMYSDQISLQYIDFSDFFYFSSYIWGRREYIIVTSFIHFPVHY